MVKYLGVKQWFSTDKHATQGSELGGKKRGSSLLQYVCVYLMFQENIQVRD